MCPTTLTLIAAGATAGSALLGGLSAAGQANYQSQVAHNNAVTARANAAHAAAATAVQTEQAGLKARAQGAGLRAALGASGVDVNSGSAGDVQTSQRAIGALEQSTVAERGARATYGYEVQGVSYDAESKLYRSQVVPDILGGVLGAVGAGAGKLADMPSGGGSGGSQYPTIEGTQPSLLSGAPDLPSQYSWMQTATPQEAYDYGDF